MEKSLNKLFEEVAKKSSSKLIGDVLDPAYDWTKSKYQIHKYLKNDTRQYMEYCLRPLIFKTIASNDQYVYIDHIYVPLIIKWEQAIGLEINGKVTLESEEAIIIKGVAGQGKSTILRKMLANTINAQKRIPIYYELKNYRGGSIMKNVARDLRKSGIKIDEDALWTIINDRDSIVLLDAFDEVDPSLREQLLEEIRCVANFNCKFVCTTRPDTELDSLPIKTYKVQTLKPSQVYQIIEKTATDLDKARSLILALKDSRLHSSEDSVLKTPILVALLCVSYNLGEEIPESLSQFYKNIFDTVFYKHDNLKGRVNRVRYWNDNRQTYLSVFECFSYASLIRHDDTLDKRQALGCMKEALAYYGLWNDNEEMVFEELCRITNLLFSDGYDKYRFAHKSIQEYYTASFIAHLPDKEKQGFYAKSAKQYNYHSLVNGVLFFLEEIDYFNFAKYYLVPSVDTLLDLNGAAIDDGARLISDNLLDTFFDEITLHAEFSKIKNKTGGLNKVAIDKQFKGFHFDRYANFPETYNRLFMFALNHFFDLKKEKKHIFNTIEESGDKIEQGLMSITLGKYSRIRSKKDDLRGVLGMAAAVLFKKSYNEALRQLQNRSTHMKDSELFDFSL